MQQQPSDQTNLMLVLFLIHQYPDNKGERQTQKIYYVNYPMDIFLIYREKKWFNHIIDSKSNVFIQYKIKLKYLDTRTTILTEGEGPKRPAKNKSLEVLIKWRSKRKTIEEIKNSFSVS